MRIIDADALIDALPIVTDDKQISLIGAVTDMVVLILQQPTVDAKQVIHGQWVGNNRHQACTCCHVTFCVPDGESAELDMSFYKYCPNCGAKMGAL